MDIAAISMNLSQQKVMQEVNVSMLKNAIETAETGGEDLAKMMEQSVLPNLGQSIDLLV